MAVSIRNRKEFVDISLQGLTKPGYSSRRIRTGNLFSVVFISRYLLTSGVAELSSSPKRNRVVLVWSKDNISWMPLRDLVTGIEYRFRLVCC